MNDNDAKTGLRRLLPLGLAYLRIGVWLLKELNPWRRPYGPRRP